MEMNGQRHAPAPLISEGGGALTIYKVVGLEDLQPHRDSYPGSSRPHKSLLTINVYKIGVCARTELIGKGIINGVR